MLLRFILTLMISCSFMTTLSAGVVGRTPPNGINTPFGILNNPSYHPGFFSALFTVIGFLEEHEKENWGGYLVDFQDKGAYYEPQMGNNWWSYYFNPLFQECPGFHDDRVVVEDQKMQFGFNTLFHTRPDVYHVIQNYIQVNNKVQKAVDDSIQQLFAGSPAIGINFQKPERAYVSANTNFENFYNAINKLLAKEEYEDCKIFVSTDDDYFLDDLIAKYGSKVVYRDVPRYSSVGRPAYNTMTPNYDRGFDEIVECLMLANCEAIVRTNSHISTAASFFNPKLSFITVRTVVKK